MKVRAKEKNKKGNKSRTLKKENYKKKQIGRVIIWNRKTAKLKTKIKQKHTIHKSHTNQYKEHDTKTTLQGETRQESITQM